MDDRISHLSKTQHEKSAYHNYIQHKESEPTVDEKVDFKPSTQSGEELAEPTLNRKRKIPLRTRIGDFVSNYWLETLITIIIAILGFTVIQSKIDLAVVEEKIGYQKETLLELKNDIGKTFSELQNQISQINSNYQTLVSDENKQNLLLSEIKLRLEFLGIEIE